MTGERRRGEGSVLRPRDLGIGQLFERVRDAVIVAEAGSGRVVLWNPAAARIFGWSASEAVGMSVEELVPERLRERHREGMSRYRDTGRGHYMDSETLLDLPALRKDGREIRVEMSLSPVEPGPGAADGERYVLAIVRDVTGRKVAHDALRRAHDALEERIRERTAELARANAMLEEREARYRGIFDSNVVGLYFWDSRGRVSLANDAFLAMTGYGREDLEEGRLARRSITPEEHRALDEGMLRETLEKGACEPYEIEYLRKDGDRVPVVVAGALLEGHADEGVCVVVDISGRKRAEDELRRQRDLYEAILTAQSDLGEGFVILEDRRIVYANDAFCRMVGYEPEELEGTAGLAGLADEEELASLAERRRRRLETGETHYDTALRRKDGGRVEAEISFKPIEAGGSRVVVLVRDITGRKRYEEELRRSEGSLRAAQRMAHLGDWEYDLRSDRARWSEELYRIFGYSPNEFVPTYRKFFDLVHPDDRGAVRAEVFGTLRGGQKSGMDYRIVRSTGGVRYVHTEYEVVRDGSGRPTGLAGTIQDLTEREEAERRLREAEARFRTLVEQIPAITYVEAVDSGERTTDLVYMSPQVEEMFGYSPEEWTSDPGLFPRLLHPEDRERVLAEDARTDETGEPFRAEYRQYTREGRVIWVRDEAVLVRDEEGKPLYWQGVMFDVTEQKQLEEKLRKQNAYLEGLHETTLGLIERLEPADLLRSLLERTGELLGTPHGFVYLADATGTELEVRVGSGLFAGYVGYGIRPGEGLAGRVYVSGEPLVVDDYRTWEGHRRDLEAEEIRTVAGVPLRSQRRVIGVLALSYSEEGRKFGPEEVAILSRFAALASVALDNARLYEAAQRELEARKKAEEVLASLVEKLKRSNAELEQFAYVASHDLQEPLRMVASYTQLLARRYRGRLDETADEFIGYAVDGAERMQALINDLLAYSRVGTRGKPLAPTDANAAFEAARDNLSVAIEEAGAEVMAEDLPVVLGDEVQLVQLFQNLISNAIKFRREEPPRVRVAAERRDGEWLFSVSDNGVGIEEQYAGRIFVIFQRLHNRTEYGGTGIGLAVCKKIVERHGGRIWVESEPGSGSTFCFTLKDGGG